MRRIFILFLLCSTAALAQESNYVGVETCRGCHSKSVQIWSLSGHAHAQSLLAPQDAKALRCLFCHATDAQKNMMNYRWTNVECEACHGPGARHVALASEKDENSRKPGGLDAVSEKTCLRCHTDVRSAKLRSFDYARARAVIRHWERERGPTN